VVQFPDEIFRSMVEATTDFIGTIDRDGGFLYLNPAGRAMLEIPLNEDIVGQSVLPYNEGPPKEVQAAARTALNTGSASQVSVFVSRSGKRIVVSQNFIVHETSHGTRYSTIARDISDRIAVEQALRHRADHDALTGLSNRSAFRRMAEELDRTSNTHLSMLDLDGFKAVNDTQGHHEGDLLLVTVANALRQALPPQSVVARLGGDEFVAITDGDLTECVRNALEPMLQPYGAGISIGTTKFTSADDLETALHEADIRLYANKRDRRSQRRPNPFEIYSSTNTSRILQSN
jgi:diguanylate cyclase (GGDEF)-like protein/PAS domain S-box-containing protein